MADKYGGRSKQLEGPLCFFTSDIYLVDYYRQSARLKPFHDNILQFLAYIL